MRYLPFNASTHTFNKLFKNFRYVKAERVALNVICLYAYTLIFGTKLFFFSVNGLGSISGSPGPPNQSMDLLAAMGLSSNESWPGISLVPGYLKGKPAYLLQGRVQKPY